MYLYHIISLNAARSPELLVPPALSAETPSTLPGPPAPPDPTPTFPEVTLELSAAILIRRGVNDRGLHPQSDVLVTL